MTVFKEYETQYYFLNHVIAYLVYNTLYRSANGIYDIIEQMNRTKYNAINDVIYYVIFMNVQIGGK